MRNLIFVVAVVILTGVGAVAPNLLGVVVISGSIVCALWLHLSLRKARSNRYTQPAAARNSKPSGVQSKGALLNSAENVRADLSNDEHGGSAGESGRG